MADSVHEQVLDAVQVKLATLALDGLEDRVYLRGEDVETWHVNASFPCLFVVPVGIEQVLGGTSAEVQMGYPVTVYQADRWQAATKPEEVPGLLKRRKLIREALHGNTLDAGDEVYRGALQPSPMSVPTPREFDLHLSPQAFQFEAFEGL